MKESKVKTAEAYNECPASALELLADIETFRALRQPQEALNRIDLYVQSHITKLEARNKELEEALKNINSLDKMEDDSSKWDSGYDCALNKCQEIAEQALNKN